MNEQQTFKVDLLKVLRSIEKNQNDPARENVAEVVGVSKEFHKSIPHRKIKAIYVEHETKTKVLAEFIKLAIEKCTTDEEVFYFLYHCIMQFALDNEDTPNPGDLFMQMLLGRGKKE
jgi:hypothetical protein